MRKPPVSFDQLVARHRGEILAYLMRLLGDWQDAQDACQETFLRACRTFGRLQADSNARAWLYKIATRRGLDFRRQRGRQAARTADVDPVELSGSVAPSVERREQLRRLARAVRALPPKQRAALMQRRFEGLRYDEIAACLGCSAASARANVYQAVKRLRAALAE